MKEKCYLICSPSQGVSDRVTGFTIRRMTRNRPYLESGEVAVQITLDLDPAAFKIPLRATVEVGADDVLVAEVEATVEKPEEQS